MVVIGGTDSKNLLNGFWKRSFQMNWQKCAHEQVSVKMIIQKNAVSN